ncbi:MAG: ribosomal protein S18-alanine N-acetyltransferase [Acidimicrobiales bacterium]|jgi:ribosomal-protein-alanine N-acetyltransferase
MGFRLPGTHRRGPESGPRGIDVVPMRRRHLKTVVAIEQTAFPSPWSLSLYLSEIAQPATRAYFVALSDGEVIGYAGLMLAVGEGHVTTIGVAQDWQRRGIGRLLLMKLARTAIDRGAEDLTLEVRVTNTGAQALYHEFGFAPAGIRKNYYAEVHEDAIVMWAHGIRSDDYGERLAAIERRMRARNWPESSTGETS